MEISTDLRLIDIVDEGFDAGVRLGELVTQGMISVPVSPDIQFAVVGSPTYFKSHDVPKIPARLQEHNCIGVRLPTHGKIYPWRFRQKGKDLKVQPPIRGSCLSISCRFSASQGMCSAIVIPTTSFSVVTS